LEIAMKHPRNTVLAACVALAAAAASGAALAPSTPLIQDGAIVVDAADFEGNMLRIPEDKRSTFRTDYDRVAAVVDNIFVARTFAARARALGLDQDPAVQRRIQQLQEGLLADLYAKKVEQESASIDLDQRAREIFKAQFSGKTKAQPVYVQYIVIGTRGRSKEDARALAERVRSEANRVDADFLALADKYSEAPDKAANGGDVGYKDMAYFTGPVATAITTLRRKGEVSQPVETPQGFYIVRFIDRKPAQPYKYEEERDAIVEGEKARLQKTRLEQMIREVRESKTVTVHRDNVEKLVVPVDAELQRRASEAAATAGAPAKNPAK